MNKKLNSEMSDGTAADKSGADDNTTSSHSSANTFVSSCCNSADLIEPDWDEVENAGSLWRAYACYICKKCGKPCEVVEQ